MSPVLKSGGKIGMQRTSMAVHSVRDDGGPPSGWKVKLFAQISGSEEFLMQLVMEMPELVDGSMIFGKERDNLKEAVVAISVEGLMPAFEYLKQIRDPASRALPILKHKQLYEGFTRALWHAYKDLMQIAAKMMEPEFGFLFQKDTQFEAHLAAWGKKYPSLAQEVAHYLRKKRMDWQNDLATFRNYLEHKDDTDPKVYEARYTPAHAEKLFDDVWRTIADILAMLVNLHLPPGSHLEEIPLNERNPVSPRRFRLQVKGLTY
jgi:hypothetical protein